VPRWARKPPASRPPPRHATQTPADRHFPSTDRYPSRDFSPVRRRLSPAARAPHRSTTDEYHYGTQFTNDRDEYYKGIQDHRQQADMNCYNCGERHNTQVCWYRERLLCLRCNEYGHKQKNCFSSTTHRYDYNDHYNKHDTGFNY
jgi:hypothetical protein